VEDGQAVLTDYPEIIAYDGVLRAVRTITKLGISRPLRDHAKVCVAEVLAEYADERREQIRIALRQRTPAELLPYMIKQPRPAAIVFMGLLSHEQRCGLLALALREAGAKKFEISLGPPHDPERPLLWVMWYAAWLCAAHLYLQYAAKGWGEPNRAVFDDTGRGVRPNKDKQPRNLYGPLIDKVLKDLAREASKSHDFPGSAEMASERKVADLIRESRTTLRRYRRHQLYSELPEARWNGDRLQVDVTGEDL
jgi:hypothetical protein